MPQGATIAPGKNPHQVAFVSVSLQFISIAV